MAYKRIYEGDALTETLSFLETLGGIDVVKAVRINTPENGTPRFPSDPDKWPVVLEVTPSVPQMHHISRVCILHMNSGYRGRGPWATKELLKTLGFNDDDVPDVFTHTFSCNRFIRGAVAEG